MGGLRCLLLGGRAVRRTGHGAPLQRENGGGLFLLLLFLLLFLKQRGDLTGVGHLQPSLTADVTGRRANVVQHVVEQEILVLLTWLQLIGRHPLLEPCLGPVPTLGPSHVGGGAVPEQQVAADGGFEAAGELAELTAIKLYQEGLHQPPCHALHLSTVQAGAHIPAHHLQGHGADVTVPLLHPRHHCDITMTSQSEAPTFDPCSQDTESV